MTKFLRFMIFLSVIISIQNKSFSTTIYQTQIDSAFIEHYNFFITKIQSKLKKDSSGNSDTYVLYDVQTYMQNAVIYADEYNDTLILSKLLKLTKTPFNTQYMTNGKWLNNSHGLVGVEVDLVISQFFSLLTRVLSACERHNIATDFSDENIKIVIDHINQWLDYDVNRNRVDDRHLFFVQSLLQFYDYMKYTGKSINELPTWKKYAQDYMDKSINPKWEDTLYTYNNKIYTCSMLDRTGYIKLPTYKYAGYGSEITKKNSDTDPNAMFDSRGIAKQPEKTVAKAALDISHARRFNWFFETVKRFGTPFGISIDEKKLQGWANNLAFRVCKGTLEDPHFTVFSDGVDGWYRVNYSGRPGFGYTTGDMDIHFVASSYGIFGVYNKKIYDWINSWANIHKSKMTKYFGAYILDYLTSISIDIMNSPSTSVKSDIIDMNKSHKTNYSKNNLNYIKLHLPANKNTKVVIHDISGKIIKTLQINNKNLDITTIQNKINLPVGIYFYKINKNSYINNNFIFIVKK